MTAATRYPRRSHHPPCRQRNHLPIAYDSCPSTTVSSRSWLPLVTPILMTRTSTNRIIDFVGWQYKKRLQGLTHPRYPPGSRSNPSRTATTFSEIFTRAKFEGLNAFLMLDRPPF
ncbi:hypothetical protein M407DRAFT_107846 [Tulasnella calospora MUT 4182]|uniref:Uncharacterized protein n=1 Tax=Tulasnella calospora MUT 4182 TaxID=1051891 RepID=A0A0C3LQ96_9AGAM|nr:hypothetical protein M407DRAFT_107846 [Tulasnella calospora MUT 4182]